MATSISMAPGDERSARSPASERAQPWLGMRGLTTTSRCLLWSTMHRSMVVCSMRVMLSRSLALGVQSTVLPMDGSVSRANNWNPYGFCPDSIPHCAIAVRISTIN
jgi:hypothetical protein